MVRPQEGLENRQKARKLFSLYFLSCMLRSLSPSHPPLLCTHRGFDGCCSLWCCLALFLLHWLSLPFWVHMAKYNSPSPGFHVFSSGDLWTLQALLNSSSKFPGESVLVWHGASNSQGNSIVTAAPPHGQAGE